MEEKDEINTPEEFAAQVLRGENRYYQEVTITKVQGACPYGHREGDTFQVTAMNSDGLCGSLLKAILPPVITQHYGGDILWGDLPGTFKGSCPEAGKVAVAVRRVERDCSQLLKTEAPFTDMTGKGYPLLDRYRLMVEVLDIAHDCYWGHRVGDRFEVDPFNVGGACCLLYGQFYPYLHVLLSG
ncbi:MAG: TIGR04076 family protein, partial [Deltaproteobacteria bacterium]|nr:TIGR04076 family protein [Deltaproteobacteria bacterium]